MYNVFSYRRRLESSKAQSRAKAQSVREGELHRQRTEELRQLSIKRAEDWTTKHISKEFTVKLGNGAATLLHPSQFKLRDSHSRDNSPNVYVRNYLLERERVAAAESDYASGHLTLATDYNPKSPHTHTNWLRGVDTSKFIAGRTIFHPQDDLSRVSSAASKRRTFALEGFDMRSVVSPSFRKRQREKEIETEEFSCFGNYSSSTFSTPKRGQEPYTEGTDAAANLLRKRDKSKEVSPKTFVSSSKGSWQPAQAQTLRGKQAEDHISTLEMVSSAPSIAHKTVASSSTKNSSSRSSASFSQKLYIKSYQTHALIAPMTHSSAKTAKKDFVNTRQLSP